MHGPTGRPAYFASSSPLPRPQLSTAVVRHPGKVPPMPFGLDTKSLVIGIVLGAVVIPRITAAVANRSK